MQYQMIEKKQKDDLLCKEENDNIRALVGQLGSITGQNRPDWEYANWVAS